MRAALQVWNLCIDCSKASSKKTIELQIMIESQSSAQIKVCTAGGNRSCLCNRVKSKGARTVCDLGQGTPCHHFSVFWNLEYKLDERPQETAVCGKDSPSIDNASKTTITGSILPSSACLFNSHFVTLRSSIPNPKCLDFI